MYDRVNALQAVLIGVVYVNVANLAPAIVVEENFPLEATDKCPGATGVLHLRLRTQPDMLAKPRGVRMGKRRSSMFPSTAVKEGDLFVRRSTAALDADGVPIFDRRHFVLTKEQLNFYVSATFMKKLDQVHLLSEDIMGDGGLTLATCWDYEDAVKGNSATDTTMKVLETFRPWEETSLALVSEKRNKTVVLSEKERKASLMMFRKICQASGVMPTLRIDLYAADGLKKVCNPYVIFSVVGQATQEQQMMGMADALEPTVSGYQISTDAPQWNESFALQNLTLTDGAALKCLIYSKRQSDSSTGGYRGNRRRMSSAHEAAGDHDEYLGTVLLPLNDMAKVTITPNDDMQQMQVANTDAQEGVWYDLVARKNADGDGATDSDEDEDEAADAVGALGGNESGNATTHGRIRLRLRLVRPESLFETAKAEAEKLAAAGSLAGSAASVPLEDELEAYFGLRCAFTGADYYCWAGTSSNRRAWVKEFRRVVKQAEEHLAAKKKFMEVAQREAEVEETKAVVELEKAKVTKTEEEVKDYAAKVEERKAALEVQFQLKELMNDMVTRVEERIAAEKPKRGDGLDETKLTELVKQMAEVERQREELEERKREHAESVRAQLESGGAPQATEAEGGYIDWLKKKMMRSQTGIDEDELNWQFAVDQKQVGNAFLHAEQVRSMFVNLYVGPFSRSLRILMLLSSFGAVYHNYGTYFAFSRKKPTPKRSMAKRLQKPTFLIA